MRTISGPFLAAVFLGCGVGAQNAEAQEVASKDSGILSDEIVVTAQKREQNAQDVGIPLTALSGRQLETLGYTQTTDIVGQVPSVQFQGAATFTTMNIRGVSQTEFTDQNELPISTNVDGVYLSSPGAVQTLMFDLDRVEVLRGPQGTLFGRNSNGGLVNYVTRRPTSDFEAYGNFTYGSYHEKRFEAAVSGPLAGDQLTGRIAAAGEFHEGYIKNRIGPDLNDANVWGARGELQWRPTSNFRALFKLQHIVDHDNAEGGYSHDPAILNSDGQGVLYDGPDAFGYQEPDNDPWTGSMDHIGFFHRKSTEAMAELSWELGDVTLTSVTDHYHLTKHYAEDTDASPNDIFVFGTMQNLDQFSQELRANGHSPSVDWTLGFYYLNIDNASSSDVDLRFLPGVIHDNRVDTTKSYALFGQIEYSFAPRWKAIVGLRGTHDTKALDAEEIFSGFFVDVLGLPAINPVDRSTIGDGARRKYSNWQGKAQLEFRPAQHVLLYGGVSRGTKAGGYQGRLTTDINDLTFGQEIITDYEAGVKSTVLDGRLQLNASAFHYKYKDYQAFLFDPVAFAANVLNLQATVSGAEVEMVAHPTDRVEFSLGASFLDTKVPNVTLPSGRIVDRVLPQAPAFSLSGLGRYVLPLSSGTKFTFQADFHYNSNFFFTVVNAPDEHEKNYTVVNMRLAYETSDGRLGIAVFGRNIFSEKYRIYALDLAGDFGISNDRYAPPAWYGVSVNLKY